MGKLIANLTDVSILAKHQLILETINLDIFEGEILSIIGPNGGGKTMLMKTIIGIEEIGAGKISKNKEISMAYMPQIINIPRHLPITARDFIFLNMNVDKVDMDICKRLNISECLDLEIHSLSGGEMKKVVFAAVVMSNAKTLLLDEPEQHLDINSRKTIYEIIKEQSKQHKKTIVLISHDLQNGLKYSDRIALINRKIHYVGHPAPDKLLELQNTNDLELADFLRIYGGIAKNISAN
jgi:zinc transport system ATP-binding protein